MDESTASDISSFLDEMDNYLDEAVGSESGCEGPTPPKQGKHASQPVRILQSLIKTYIFIDLIFLENISI